MVTARHVSAEATPGDSALEEVSGEIALIVAGRRIIAEGVVLLSLRAARGEALPEWTPGAHIDLCLAPGLTRQYSLIRTCEDGRCWEVAVQRVREGRGSRLVHENLAVGACVGAVGPRNNFPLVASQRYLFIAGGIGITPLLPMVASAEAEGASWELHYGGRQRRSMAFVKRLERFGDKVRIHPQDETGLLDLPAILGFPRPGAVVYCCGPRSLLDAVEECCASWPAGSLHVESFSPRPVSPSASNRAFDVVLARSGRTLHVPEGHSILQVLEQAGMSPPASCAEGVCGTCETAVLGGEPDHRDSVLTAQEPAWGETMMICVSRSRTPRLTLDL